MLKQLLRHLPKHFSLIHFILSLKSASVHGPALGEVRVCDSCSNSASAYGILMKQDFGGITKAHS